MHYVDVREKMVLINILDIVSSQPVLAELGLISSSISGFDFLKEIGVHSAIWSPLWAKWDSATAIVKISSS